MATPSLLYSIITMTSEDLITIIYISTYTCTHVHVCTFHFFVHFFICIFYHINAFTHQVTKSGSVYKAYQIHYMVSIRFVCVVNTLSLSFVNKTSLITVKNMWALYRIVFNTLPNQTPAPTIPPTPSSLPPKIYYDSFHGNMASWNY